jgi:hypothetical protein
MTEELQLRYADFIIERYLDAVRDARTHVMIEDP